MPPVVRHPSDTAAEKQEAIRCLHLLTAAFLCFFGGALAGGILGYAAKEHLVSDRFEAAFGPLAKESADRALALVNAVGQSLFKEEGGYYPGDCTLEVAGSWAGAWFGFLLVACLAWRRRAGAGPGGRAPAWR